MTISKKERKAAFKKLEGWFYTKAVIQDAYGTRKSNYFNIFKLNYIEPKGEFALYQSIQLTPFLVEVDDPRNTKMVSIREANGNIISYGIILQVGIATYDQTVDDQMRLEVENNDSQTIASCEGNGKLFTGRENKFKSNTSAYVSGFTLKKLKNTPNGFADFNFDVIYNDSLNNNNNNNNNDTNITLESIATESAPNIWVINTDVTISPNQTLVIDQGVTVTTFYNITNSGKFTNGGTFCIAKNNFTNNTNADFNNNGGTTLIYLGGTLKNNGRIDNKSGGKVINLQSTYDGFRVVGNPIVTLTY